MFTTKAALLQPLGDLPLIALAATVEGTLPAPYTGARPKDGEIA